MYRTQIFDNRIANLEKNMRKINVVVIYLFLLLVLTYLGTNVSAGDNWYHYEQGIRLINAKSWEQAQKNFDYYLNHPEMHRQMFGVAHLGKGLMFQAMGRYDRAFSEFQMAIENDLHPEVKISDKAYMNIGNIYFKNKAYQDAIQAYLKTIKIDHRNGLAHYYLGMSYLRNGEYEKAEKEAAEAKRLGVPFTALLEELTVRENSKTNVKEPNKNIEKK